VRRQRQSRRSRSFGLAIDPADIATTLLARGEFALLLGAMATSAGLDSRLSSFIAGYVLLLAVLGPDHGRTIRPAPPKVRMARQ
jgi:hypothetical protein